MVNKYNKILSIIECRKLSKIDNKIKGITDATVKFGGYKKMQIEFLNYCKNNNINLSVDILKKILNYNKEAI
jgi:hypothetical protein